MSGMVEPQMLMQMAVAARVGCSGRDQTISWRGRPSVVLHPLCGMEQSVELLLRRNVRSSMSCTAYAIIRRSAIRMRVIRSEGISLLVAG